MQPYEQGLWLPLWSRDTVLTESGDSPIQGSTRKPRVIETVGGNRWAMV